jgi:hypothetical protein
MTAKHPWTQGTAAGTALVKLAELYARALRVDMERRAQNAKRMHVLLSKDKP